MIGIGLGIGVAASRSQSTDLSDSRLLEDGFFRLLESGFNYALESGVVVTALFMESSASVLLEDGSELYLG